MPSVSVLREQWEFVRDYVQHPIWWVMLISSAALGFEVIGQNEGFYARLCTQLYSSDPKVCPAGLICEQRNEQH